MKAFLSQFRFYRRRAGRQWFYVFDNLDKRYRWINGKETWTHQDVVLEERYNEKGKLVFQWVR